MPYSLSPVLQGQLLKNPVSPTSGVLPLAGGKVFTYQGGSFSVPATTYADKDGSVENTNPIVLDSAGRVPAFWLDTSLTYNLVLTLPDGTTILQTYENVQAGISEQGAETIITTLLGNYVEKTGDTMSGSLLINAGLTANTLAVSSNASVGGNLVVTGNFTADKVTAELDGANQRIQNVANPSAADDAATKSYVDTAVGDTAVTGAIVMFGRNTPPAGWLECNGAAVSRSTYAALFAVIGTTFGPGNGSTTFNVPDMRGYFARGWDDGAGVDPGRVFGSTQADALKNHTHTFDIYELDDTGGLSFVAADAGGDENAPFTTEGTGDAETRPKNVAFLYIIKT